MCESSPAMLPEDWFRLRGATKPAQIKNCSSVMIELLRVCVVRHIIFHFFSPRGPSPKNNEQNLRLHLFIWLPRPHPSLIVSSLRPCRTSSRNTRSETSRVRLRIPRICQRLPTSPKISSPVTTTATSSLLSTWSVLTILLQARLGKDMQSRLQYCTWIIWNWSELSSSFTNLIHEFVSILDSEFWLYS